ncbi:ABC-type amino acid transport substrate-binding protein [Variovorax sp. GrIS 2.14]|uniref:hypothetical protein n=1 Tax=Variovorax sp. GrIS 2.14 TaxID=3071709 RepID=UPI0038F6B0F8
MNSGVQLYTLASTADVSAPIDLCGKTIGTSQLKQGRFAGGAQGSETVPYTMTLEPNTYKPVGMPFGGAQQGMAFAKADAQLRDAVLGAFKKVAADGTYASIIAKWNLQSSAIKQIAVNGTPEP